MHNLEEKDFQKILSYKDLLVGNAKKLTRLDPNDDYWKFLVDEKMLMRNGVFLETNMVTSWIGETRKPKRILEIGTRTGGSLIALLCVYGKKDLDAVEEIISFDMWREYVSTTPVSGFISKLVGKKTNINISEKYTGVISNMIENNATKKVRNNLNAFSIPSDKIKFISGDSKITVPKYFQENPQKKFDYILVDGGHDELTAERDLENVAAHAAKGGVIVFDDILPESYNLIGVWNKFKEKYKNDFGFFEIHHRKGVAWAVKK
ncbi:MAG TPA: class I SAM-dependent methyltransferase [Bacteroidia bacterium]